MNRRQSYPQPQGMYQSGSGASGGASQWPLARAPRFPWHTWWARTFAWEGARFVRDGFGDLPIDRALEARRKALRSHILANIVGAILLVEILLLAIGFGEPLVWVTATAAAVLLFVALLFNRRGWVGLAAVMVALVIEAAVWPTVWVSDGGLFVDAWPAFDFVAIAALVLAATVPARRWAWTFVVVNLGVILATVYLQPWSPDMLSEEQVYGLIPLYITVISRPAMLHVLVVVSAVALASASWREIGRADNEARQRQSEAIRADLAAAHGQQLQDFATELIDVATQRTRFAGDVPAYAQVESAQRAYVELQALRHRQRRTVDRRTPAEYGQCGAATAHGGEQSPLCLDHPARPVI